MIFATVGTQLPFRRLIDALDAIAERRGLTIVAQTCDPARSYSHLDAHAQLDPASFDRYVDAAELIVGHAGIGTILSARRAGKPLVILPRRASLGEHRNEHQLATAGSVGQREGIHIADDEAELERWLTAGPLPPMHLGDSPDRAPLVRRLAAFIAQ